MGDASSADAGLLGGLERIWLPEARGASLISTFALSFPLDRLP
jgi:hypothetical protein